MDQAEILAEIGMGSLVIGWGGWLLARDRGIDARAFGLRTFPGRWLLAAVILFALFFWVDEILSGLIDPTGELQEELIADLFQLRQSLFWAVAVAVTIGPIAAVSEEILFRGLLYRWFRERMGIAMAALLSAAIFAIAHFYFLSPGDFAGLITTLGVFVFGLVAALLYQISSSLWPSILFHAFNNVAVVCAAYLPPAG
jgi:membrane protease YdiL (CAAX protease family)